jgi:membrane fusion protein (multidrug efflux system)
VEKIFFHKGKTVKKNELLVQLSNELYSQALIERNTLEKDFNRVARLHEKESISVQDYDHIKAKYEASKAKTKMLRKNSEIRAPFSGTIVDYLVLEGENFFFAPSLKAGYSHTSGIVQLMQLDILKVEIAVNEKEISKIKKGQIAQIKFDAYPQDKYKGIVKTINPILSTLTRTAKVELEINNSKRKIKPGMYANVNIELQKRKAIFIPLKAIYRLPGTGNDYVFVINNKIAKRVAIEKFETIGNLVAVKGIKKNVEIALAGKNKLRNLSKVSF